MPPGANWWRFRGDPLPVAESVDTTDEPSAPPTNRFPTGQRGLCAYSWSGSAVVGRNALRYLELK